MLLAGYVLSGFASVAARAFKFSDASLQLRDTLRLQQEDLALQIGEARGLHIFEIFEGLEASERCFDIWWACVLFQIGMRSCKPKGEDVGKQSTQSG